MSPSWGITRSIPARTLPTNVPLSGRSLVRKSVKLPLRSALKRSVVRSLLVSRSVAGFIAESSSASKSESDRAPLDRDDDPSSETLSPSVAESIKESPPGSASVRSKPTSTPVECREWASLVPDSDTVSRVSERASSRFPGGVGALAIGAGGPDGDNAANRSNVASSSDSTAASSSASRSRHSPIVEARVSERAKPPRSSASVSAKNRSTRARRPSKQLMPGYRPDGAARAKDSGQLSGCST